MNGLLKLMQLTWGESATAANNFTADAGADDGTMRVYRGNAGAGTQDVLTVTAAGKGNANQGMQSQGEGVMRFRQIPVKATTSGTEIVFSPADNTGIPDWAQEVLVIYADLSTNGTDIVQLQLGTSAGFETTGYLGSVGGTNTSGDSSNLRTTGLPLHRDSFGAAAATRSGIIRLTLMGGNQWLLDNQGAQTDTAIVNKSDCSKTLSGTLDRLRLTTVSGTNAFDLGNVSVMVKG